MSDSDGDDPLDAFFSGSIKLPKVQAPKPSLNVKIKITEGEEIDWRRSQSNGMKSAKKEQEREQIQLATQFLNMPKQNTRTLNTDSLSEDHKFDLGIKNEKEEAEITDPDLEIYSHYSFNQNPAPLPILKQREKVLRAITENPVVVLTASTGTGKSSQVPQYILDEAYRQNKFVNIIISQPRRIAATSIAKFVANERKCEIGTLVGYQIGNDTKKDEKKNSDTRILYCTTGVLLQKLINQKSLKQYTHVILDEIHDRNMDLDMALIVIRRLLATKNPYVKLIMMSANVNAQKFANYFKSIYDGVFRDAPVLNLEIKKPFPVQEHYLNELEHMGAKINLLDKGNPCIKREMYKFVVDVLKFLIRKASEKDSTSDITFLIFLPGLREIESLQQKLCGEMENTPDLLEFPIFILHSTFNSIDQKVFSTSCKKKIILATNIAESSITFPNVRFVIDFCLTRYYMIDTNNNAMELRTVWASKTSLAQRSGRVGRTQPGQVLRLIFRDHYTELPADTIPEMCRSSLETVVLKAKLVDMGRPTILLSLALDPPPKRSVLDAVLSLKQIGGLLRVGNNGKFDKTDGELTFLGRIMAKLPIGVRLSKLIVLGYLFSVLEECIIIGAAMATKPVFIHYEGKMEIYHEMLEKAQGTGSDHILTLLVYRSWIRAVANGLKGKREQEWCRLQKLDLKNLKDLHEQVEDINNRLEFFRLKNVKGHQWETENEKFIAIKICIAGAFFPNYYSFGGKPPMRTAYSQICNLNPCTTVYFKGMDNKRIGALYEQLIRREFIAGNICDGIHDMRVHFDSNSTRFFVTFGLVDDIKVPGEVKHEVYKAIKWRTFNHKLQIKAMNINSELRYALNNELGEIRNDGFTMMKRMYRSIRNCIYPNGLHMQIPGVVTKIYSCSRFYFQPDKGKQNISKLTEILQGMCMPIDDFTEVLGRCLIVEHNDSLLRATIVAVPENDEDAYTLQLIDYGSHVEVGRNQLLTVGGPKALQAVFDLPPQCFECRLAEIKPHPLKSTSGWSQESKHLFEEFIGYGTIELEIYSFVNNVASVRVFNGPDLTINNLNKVLVLEELAQEAEESYVSMLNNIKRFSTNKKNPKDFNELEDDVADYFVMPPPEDMLTETLEFDGPFSPLEATLENVCREREGIINIHNGSVNHVLFDPYPHDGVTKVLVAGVKLKNQSSEVTLRDTTVMPAVPGMECLLSLLFSPLALISHDHNERYTTVLTGLGCNPKTKKPYYGENDTVSHVDVELDDIDFKLINDIRAAMTFLTQIEPGKTFQTLQEYEKTNACQEIGSNLMKLLLKKRARLGVKYIPNEYSWTNYEHTREDLLPEGIYPNHVYPFLLAPINEVRRCDLLNEYKELKQLAKTNVRDKIIECHLCGIQLGTVIDLQLHVETLMHKQRYLSLKHAGIC